jgi:hypothetical protein
MRGGARDAYTPPCHHVKTLATTSYRPNLKTLVAQEVLAHPCISFHPCMCGLRGGAATVAAMLINDGDVRSLLGHEHGGGKHVQLFSLHRRATMLDRCSDSSSVALHV